jgi:hypothetical protein
MGQSVFPAPSVGTSSQLPAGHAVVIADGTVAPGSSKTVTTTIKAGAVSCYSGNGTVALTFNPSGTVVIPPQGWVRAGTTLLNDQTSVVASRVAGAFSIVSSQATNSGNFGFLNLKYGNNRAVACNTGSGVSTYTSNGVDWTAGSMPSSQNWNGMAFGNNTFVAVAYTSNQAASSSDGITWTTRTMANNTNWTPIWYGGGLFVAAAWGPTTIANTSPDGITWTARTLPNADWYAGAYGNGVHVVVAGTSSTYATSTDGITWTSRSFAANFNAYGAAFGNGIFVVTSGNSTSYYTSPDGTTWTARTVANQNGQNITFGGGLFFWPDTDSTNLYTSSDGINWVASSLPASGYHTSTYMDNMGAFVALKNSTVSGNAVRVTTTPTNDSFGVYGGVATIS